jgi:NAD(P)-dependent dehydrogenase (short-subunit alcohol dehydrogenase family)
MSTTFGAASTTDDVLKGIDLTGKTALITGVSAGLGVETTRSLIAHGAKVVGTARNIEKAKTATKHIDELVASGTGAFDIIRLDLADQSSARSAAEELLARGEKFDYVIANAGVMETPFELTKDGHEMQLASNVLGHFTFINKIIPLVKENGGRIVILSSCAHRGGDFNHANPNFLDKSGSAENKVYDAKQAYFSSKTANSLYAVCLDDKLKSKGIRVVAVHPGAIMTELTRHYDEEAMAPFQHMHDTYPGPEPMIKEVPQGAATSVWAAVVASDEEAGGKYAENCHIAEVVDNDAEVHFLGEGVKKYAVDLENAKRFWAIAEELIGEKF